jgi:hypothetical protein
MDNSPQQPAVNPKGPDDEVNLSEDQRNPNTLFNDDWWEERMKTANGTHGIHPTFVWDSVLEDSFTHSAERTERRAEKAKRRAEIRAVKRKRKRSVKENRDRENQLRVASKKRIKGSVNFGLEGGKAEQHTIAFSGWSEHDCLFG